MERQLQVLQKSHSSQPWLPPPSRSGHRSYVGTRTASHRPL
ncbi:hypothetical protein LINPERPRIM_LOCUS30024 [Linum perenne]